MTHEDRRRHAPAAERNRGPLLDVLRGVLPPSGTVLEIASGSGQHAVFFARALPHLTFQPSERDEAAHESIRAWIEHERLENVRAPLLLDVTAASWPVTHADAMLCINMVHISPWEATLALLDGAARLLPTGAPLVLYGPYQRGGEHTAPSNAAFDVSLRSRDPAWGVRDLDDVTAAASERGLSLDAVHEMPANNLTVVFRRR